MTTFVSTKITKIKDSILSLFQKDKPDPKQIDEFFMPLATNMDNIFIRDNILSVIDIIVKDRDGNNIFDFNDLYHLSHDFTGIMALTKAIILILGSITDFKMKYKKGDTEELIFKLLTYIFLIVIPFSTGHIWTNKEKEDIINISFTMYQLIASSNQGKQIMENIADWLKVGYICVSKPENKKAKIQKYLPSLQYQLSISIENARTKSRLAREVTKLKIKIGLLEQINKKQLKKIK